MGDDYFGNLQAALNNVATQQSQQQYSQGYLGQWTSGGNLLGSSAIGLTGVGLTGGSTTTITVDASYGIEAKAKPKTNLAWLDEDIARYRVKLAA